jgi:hypothetical protein
MLRKSYQGIETDVVEVGRFRALSGVLPIPQRRTRPARPGNSVGFKFPPRPKAGYVMAGTFGALVAVDGVWYILSNNHVLADENALPVGSPIFQPGLLDHGSPANDQIAKLSRFIPLGTTNPNTVDCAIAEVLNKKLVSAICLPKVGRLHDVTPIPAVEGMSIHKVGGTTNYTVGSVFDMSADVIVQYDAGGARFNDQVLIRGDGDKPFSAAGDSELLIVGRATARARALHFAGSSSHTIANHLSDVLAALQVTVVN